LGESGFLSRLRRGRDAAQRTFVVSAVTPLVLYMAFFTLFPMLWGLALAFFDYSARRSGGPILGLGGDNPFVGLQNFQDMANLAPDAELTVRQFHIASRPPCCSPCRSCR
jgi:ABC-type sugar transport system permease subunit